MEIRLSEFKEIVLSFCGYLSTKDSECFIWILCKKFRKYLFESTRTESKIIHWLRIDVGLLAGHNNVFFLFLIWTEIRLSKFKEIVLYFCVYLPTKDSECFIWILCLKFPKYLFQYTRTEFKLIHWLRFDVGFISGTQQCPLPVFGIDGNSSVRI